MWLPSALKLIIIIRAGSELAELKLGQGRGGTVFEKPIISGRTIIQHLILSKSSFSVWLG